MIFNRSPEPALLGQGVIASQTGVPEREMTDPKRRHIRGLQQYTLNYRRAAIAALRIMQDQRCDWRVAVRRGSGPALVILFGREALSVATDMAIRSVPISYMLFISRELWSCRTASTFQPPPYRVPI
jgi:hypothetical protein